MLTQAEFVALLREQATPNQKALAKRIGIRESYLSDVLSGKRDPGKTIQAAMGVELVKMYRKVDKQ